MREIIIDSFAGGGGASLGMSRGVGQSPDVAINHDAAAIAMHAANHPETRHVAKDIRKVRTSEVTQGRSVGLYWASPDCKHFSRAKGGKPVDKKIRGLAWEVIRWAVEQRPRVIILENVREFEDWGPLIQKLVGGKGQVLDDGSPVLIPDPTRKGHSFKRWAGRLRGLGYDVQWRVLNAADYGAPTHRRRLFLIARCDGLPIVWPEPTHGDPKKIGQRTLFGPALQPWRTAASCIDWTIPCPSIFDRKKDLEENTLRRIAMGIKRYVLENPKPFIVQVNHAGPEFRGQELAHGKGPDGSTFNDGRAKLPDEPLGTIHAGGNNHALLAATMVQTGYTEREGQAPRCLDLNKPLGTVVDGQKHAAVTAFLAKHFGGPRQTAGQGVDEPLRTQTTGNHAALVYAFLTKYFGTAIGANLIEPAPTATGKDRFGLVTVHVNGEPYVIVDIGMRMLSPRELARAQGFPDSYVLTGSKSSQVARIGNSVCPCLAEALSRANYTPANVKRRAATA